MWQIRRCFENGVENTISNKTLTDTQQNEQKYIWDTDIVDFQKIHILKNLHKCFRDRLKFSIAIGNT